MKLAECGVDGGDERPGYDRTNPVVMRINNNMPRPGGR